MDANIRMLFPLRFLYLLLQSEIHLKFMIRHFFLVFVYLVGYLDIKENFFGSQIKTNDLTFALHC